MAAALAALVVGGFGYGVSITLWVAGARELGAARGQLIFATAPFVGVVVAWTALGDQASWRELISLVIAAFGVSLVVGSEHEHAHVHRPVQHDHEHIHPDVHHIHVDPDGFTGRHQHAHTHRELVHCHPHVPDLHHRHDHARS
jgi:hypothetical protein